MIHSLLVLCLMTTATQGQEPGVRAPAVVLRGVPFALELDLPATDAPAPLRIVAADGSVLADTVAAGGSLTLRVAVASGDAVPITVSFQGASGTTSPRVLPGLVSILPPLAAILLALIIKEVITSLVAGIWLGAMFLTGFDPLRALLMSIDRFALEALADSSHASIVVFSLLLGGMVGLMGRMGGSQAIVNALEPIATSRRRGLLATWFAGLAVFFDDYANSLVVGNTMRPVTDRLRISREKLAYIVDSTAAPVTAIVFVSTWVGYEISLIGDGLALARAQHGADAAITAGLTLSPFSVFVSTVPYLFYPLLALAMVATLTLTGRDFGPMLAAERRAASGGGVFRPGAQLAADVESDLGASGAGVTPRWWNGVLPIVVLVVTVLWGLYATGSAALAEGMEPSLRNIFSGADPYRPLIWGSLLACLTSVVLATTQRLLTLNQSIEAFTMGVKSMAMAMMILVLAWSLAAVTNELNTAGYLSSVISEALPIRLLPLVVFVVAGATAFATGTSWGTMAILIPIVIPLTVALGGADVVAGGAHHQALLGAIAAVLSGAVFGDHCSPISDTTVLSSMASGCDHLDHVRTQMPYALAVAAVAILAGSLGTALGLPVAVALGAGLVGLVGVVLVLGKKVEG